MYKIAGRSPGTTLDSGECPTPSSEHSLQQLDGIRSSTANRPSKRCTFDDRLLKHIGTLWSALSCMNERVHKKDFESWIFDEVYPSAQTVTWNTLVEMRRRCTESIAREPIWPQSLIFPIWSNMNLRSLPAAICADLANVADWVREVVIERPVLRKSRLNCWTSDCSHSTSHDIALSQYGQLR